MLPVGAVVQVSVRVGRRIVEVDCEVVEHPRGTAYEPDLEALRSALEEAAAEEELSIREGDR